MLYRIAALAAFLVSADALKIGAGMTRRSAVAKVASLAAVAPLAAFAELKKAGDADIYANAECAHSSPTRTIALSLARSHTRSPLAAASRIREPVSRPRRAMIYNSLPLLPSA